MTSIASQVNSKAMKSRISQFAAVPRLDSRRRPPTLQNIPVENFGKVLCPRRQDHAIHWEDVEEDLTARQSILLRLVFAPDTIFLIRKNLGFDSGEPTRYHPGKNSKLPGFVFL
jgi:hypothetical protein